MVSKKLAWSPGGRGLVPVRAFLSSVITGNRTGGLRGPAIKTSFNQFSENRHAAAPARFSCALRHNGFFCHTRKLRSREIDAPLAPNLPSAFLAGDPRIVRMFADFEAEERACHVRTGFFPIMHVIAVRCSLVETHPGLPRARKAAVLRLNA